MSLVWGWRGGGLMLRKCEAAKGLMAMEGVGKKGAG